MTAREAAWAVMARHLAASSRPIIAGPWRSEVGFEVLYWVPFLCLLQERYSVGRDRLIVVGRGGSAAWYRAAGTADLYEFMPVEMVRTLGIQASQQTGSMKQHGAEGWERQVCGLLARGLGLVSYQHLSPSWMYHLCAPFWQGRQPLEWLDRYLLQPVKLPAPALDPAVAERLPGEYVAMRWYSRPTWPANEKLMLWTRQLVQRIAAKRPVVMVDSGFHADDHADLHVGDIPNVTRLSAVVPMTPLTNLAVQSAVIARAKAYLGTYGGLAQGAMRWGVPTYAFFESFQQTSPAHLHLSHSLSLRTGVPFWAGTPAQFDRLSEVI